MLRTTWAVARKEMLHILRSPGSLFLVLGSPVLMLILMAYALAADIKSVPVAVVDYDLTPLSRAYVRQLMSGADLNLTGYAASMEEIDSLLAHNTIRAGIVIQPGFETRVQGLEGFPVQVIVDGTEPTAGGFALNHIAAHTQHFIETQARAAEVARGVPSSALQSALDARVRVWYNPGLKAVQDVVPALIAVILGLPAVALSAAMAREKEHRTLEQLIVTPIGKLALLTGKMTPYLISGVLAVFLLLIVSQLLFGVVFRGSLFLLLLLSLDYFIANLGIGLIISIYSRTQQAAMVFSLMIFLFPGFFLSGIFFPLIAMPPEARLEANMLPTTQFVNITRGLFLKGVGLDVLWQNALILLLMGLACGVFSLARFRKKLA